MNTTNKITEKRTYFPPIVDMIELDNEISLALESNPPNGPDEVNNLGPTEYSIKNPYNKFI
jgi:hypothetical protein